MGIEATLKERLQAEGLAEYNEVAAVNLIAVGISLLITARGHQTTIEMLERAIVIVDEDRAALMGKAITIDDKPKPALPTETGGTVSILGMRYRGPRRHIER